MIKDTYPNIKPSLNLDFANTKTLDSRVSFRRGTPGAYYDGKTHVKAEENLIANSTVWSDSVPWDGTPTSNNNSGWNFVNTTVHDNQPSPDGTNTAYKLSPTDSATTAAIWPGVSKSTEAQTFSIYIKMDSPDYTAVALYWNSSGTTHARFNLLTGQVTLDQGAGRIEASMHDVGDGWWRCVATHSEYSSTNATMYVLVDDTSATDFARWSETDGPDGVKGLLAWHPQIETRDFVTAYTPTNGTPVTKYQPQLMFASSDQPRFDHDPLTGESKGLLIEESRTNLTRDSQYFASTNWNRFNANIFSNYVVAPDGTLTGSVMSAALTQDDYVGVETIASYITYTQGKSYTSSYYLKKGSHNYCQLYAQGLISSDFANFNLDTGEVSGSSNASIEHVGNGWYRCSLTVVANTSVVTAASFLLIVDSMSSIRGEQKTYTNTDDNIYIWGAQFEEGSFPTSYIKTSGASATRSADDASITGENFSSWYRQDEGSIVSEGSIDMNNRKGGTGMPLYNVLRYPTSLVGLSRDSSYWYHGIINNAESNYRYWSDVESATGAITYNYNDGYIHSYINGNQNLSSTTWIDRDENIVHEHAEMLKLGTGGGVNNVLNGHIKRFTYYPQQLTNEQLQNLTQ